MQIFCLMFCGRPISEEIRTLLFQAAAMLIFERRRQRTIATDFYEGEVTTEFKDALLGTYAGKVFSARVDFEGGTTRVNFIVRTADLEEAISSEGGEWKRIMIPVRSHPEGKYVN